MSLEKAEEGRLLQKSRNPLCYCYTSRGQGIFAGGYDNQKLIIIITPLPQQQEFWGEKQTNKNKQLLLLWGQGRNRVRSRGDFI